MKKAIKRFWGIGLIVIILSSLFVAPASVSGGNYTFSADTTQPTTVNRLLNAAGSGIFDADQTSDGATIYVVGTGKTIYKSTNGGTTWTPATASGTTGSVSYDLISVAPDNSNIVVIADKTSNIVFLSTNGGSSFSALGVPGAVTAPPDPMTVINDIDVSVQSGPSRYIAVAGLTAAGPALYIWAYGATAPAWYNIVAGGGSPPWTPLAVAIEEVEAVAFSSSFASDQAILFVAEDTGVAVQLHVGSFNIRKFNNNVDATFPRTLEAGVVTSAKADIVLDPAFYLGDEATQIGFIGAEILVGGVTEVGGVYRTTYSFTGGANTLHQIMADTAVGSVAYDGTNLVAAPYTVANAILTIYRSSNPLATASSVSFLPSATAKTPGTGFGAIVMFNGTNVLCFSQGNNGGVARSADLGRAFNGIALLNTNLNLIRDFTVSPDGKTIYMLADDGVDANVWRYKDNVWQRVMIISGGTGATWLIRASDSDPTAVMLGLMGGANMYISTNAGETSWTARSCSTNIQDFVVETKDIVYVASIGTGTGSTNIVKSSNGAFTWGPPTNTNINQFGGGNIYSISLAAAGKILVGGMTGGVAYSTDSGATWVGMQPLNTATTNVLVAATGLETGDTIFAAGAAAASKVSKWKIGTNAAPTYWTEATAPTAALTTGATGLAYVNGVLYVIDDTTGNFFRYLSPVAGPFGPSDTIAETGGYSQATRINALSGSTGSTTIWLANSTPAPDTLDSWTEYLAKAADAPKLTFPTADYMVQVNSLTGAPNNFVFQWSAPAAISTSQSYGYDIEVYLDSAGQVRVAQGAVAMTPAGTVSIGSNVGGWAAIPGTTYYWRVRVAANSPVRSQWAEMRKFTIQPLAAAVPVVASPANGATIMNQSPAFSWSPVTSTTKYEFQLSTTPTFGTTVLTDTPSTAGALVPVTIKLEQGKQYFWRVRALEPVQGDWSTVANFVVAAAPTTAPPAVTITQVPAPIITIPPAPAAPTYTLVPPAEEVIAPTYIWAIIIIGAILVIAVIVLIVRTRRSV